MQNTRRAWWFVALLCCASLLSVIDRSIVNLVVDPLRAELGLSDVQIGLLQGLAFSIVYAIGGLLLGVAVDRYHRRNLIVFGIAVWSMATIAAGLAQNFAQLFVARVLVGLGEGALSPAAVSLIADLFARDRRARPMGFFMTAQGLANGLAISVTGVVIAAAASGSFAAVHLLAGLSPWRIAFVLFGFCGVLVAATLFSCTEPRRERVSAARSLFAQSRETLSYMVARWRFFAPLYLGFALCFLAAYGSAAWAPAMLGRVYGLGPAALAATLGPLSMAFAVSGPLLGSFTLDALVTRYGDRGRLMLVAGVALLAIPSGIAVLAPRGAWATVLVASSSGVYAFVGLGVLTALQARLWPTMRGLGVALTMLINSAIGAVLGPLLIAELTQRVFRDDLAVGRSIAWVVVPALCASSAFLALAARNVPPVEQDPSDEKQ